ncbi:hypothetical protein HPP92_019082 [Vanilla planifolia]|uniref:Uncharacterized protein n=1 Tax=Vanilla planifolia TaxID=51239 RepID=A0A835QGV8_VANPL|nr:hypothetical protein HPP92_019082 [Vanilla planifolia]
MSAGGPLRATFSTVYCRPDSDSVFMPSVSGFGCGRRTAAVVDTFSCRQMYLRSYPFSTAKKETFPEKMRRCLDEAKDLSSSAIHAFPVSLRRRRPRGVRSAEKKRKTTSMKSCAEAASRVSVSTVRSVFHRFLSCATTVDVAGGNSSCK